MISPTLLQEPISGNFGGPSTGATTGSGSASGFMEIFNRVCGGTANSGSKSASGTATPSGAGQSCLDQLKKEILALGHPLKDYRVDQDALSEFGNILLKAGFAEEDVQELLSNFSTRAADNTLDLATLFKGAAQLPTSNGDGSTPVILKTASLPELTDMLGELGLGREKIRSLLSEAKVDGQGIDLRTLVASLRRTLAEDGNATESADADAAGVMQRMAQIGLSVPGDAGLSAESETPTGGRGDKSASHEKDGADGLAGSLLAVQFQQPAELSDAGQGKLHHPVSVAGKSLSSKSISPASAGVSTSGGEGSPAKGKMSLSMFVSALESRVAAEDTASGGTVANRSMGGAVGRFVAGLSLVAGKNQGGAAGSQVPAGTKAAEAFLGASAKHGVLPDSGQGAGKTGSGAGTAGKSAPGQPAAGATGPASGGNGTTGEQFSGNSGDKDPASEFADALARTDQGKRRETGTSPGADSLIREAKSVGTFQPAAKAVPSRNLPAYLLDQVSRQIVRLRTTGTNEITLQLKPPNLGRMKLSIEQTAGGLKVGIVVDHTATKEMLLAHTHILKAALGEHGIRLDKIDVHADGNFGRSMAQTGREFGQSGGQGNRRSGTPATRSGRGVLEALPSASPTEPLQSAGGGRLDLVA